MAIQRKKIKKYYTYKCNITGRSFRTTASAPHPEELMCVDAYYDVHPEKDDRPEVIKKTRKQLAASASAALQQEEGAEGGKA